jgi:hypothetical protein
MKKKIYRAIYANNISEISFSDFGCHWTRDPFYDFDQQFRAVDISGGKRRGEKYSFLRQKSMKYIFIIELHI